MWSVAIVFQNFSAHKYNYSFIRTLWIVTMSLNHVGFIKIFAQDHTFLKGASWKRYEKIYVRFSTHRFSSFRQNKYIELLENLLQNLSKMRKMETDKKETFISDFQNSFAWYSKHFCTKTSNTLKYCEEFSKFLISDTINVASNVINVSQKGYENLRFPDVHWHNLHI